MAKTDGHGTVDIDSAMPRIVNLLKVAYGGGIPDYIPHRIAGALHSWNLGQTGIALTKLTQIHLPDPFTDPAAATRLAKAEAALNAQDALRKDDEEEEEAGDGDEDGDSGDDSGDEEAGGTNGSYNSNEPRVPAGNPNGGQWTSSGASAAQGGNPQATTTSLSTSSTTVITDTYANAVSTDPNANVKGTSGMDVDAAVAQLDSIPASAKSGGYCAAYVEDAIEAGGVDLDRGDYPIAAKQKGDELLDADFVDVTNPDYTPQKGDVAIIQSYPGGNPNGHMAMWNGSIWVSDFKQRNVPPLNLPYPGPGYRAAKPTITYYRP